MRNHKRKQQAKAESAKRNLKANGISYTRPWMIILSDGEPTSNHSAWAQATSNCKSAEDQNKIQIFTIAVEGANSAKLDEISNRPSASLSGMKFKELFLWLSASLSAVTRSRPGEDISLPDADPWKHVGL